MKDIKIWKSFGGPHGPISWKFVTLGSLGENLAFILIDNLEINQEGLSIEKEKQMFLDE